MGPKLLPDYAMIALHLDRRNPADNGAVLVGFAFQAVC